jgi:dTDP-4-amino-4,6-dideoxygalactose transaminase
MSEYHAAIGLACLDAAAQTATDRIQVGEAYRAAATRAGIDAAYLMAWPLIGSNYALLEASSWNAAERLITAFAAAGIGVRRWYGRGLHRELFFSRDHGNSLLHTESLADRILGIPMFPGMSAGQMDRVMEALRAVEVSAGPRSPNVVLPVRVEAP